MLFEILKALLIAGPVYYILIGVMGVVLGDVQIDPRCPTWVRVKSLGLFLVHYPGVTLFHLWRGTHVRIVLDEED